MPKAIEQPEMIEREYGPYRAKIYFAEENIPGADEKILDAIMQSYRQRIARESQEVCQTIKQRYKEMRPRDKSIPDKMVGCCIL